MSSSTPFGNGQVPESFDNTRISPEIRRALRDHDPAIQKGVRDVADAPATPGKQVGQ